MFACARQDVQSTSDELMMMMLIMIMIMVMTMTMTMTMTMACVMMINPRLDETPIR